MFGRSSYDLSMIDTSSKMSLKLSCLRAAGDDVEKARELYDFLSQDIADLPDLAPVIPGTFDKLKQGASEVVGWVATHREELSQGLSIIRGLGANATAAPPIDVPPIPKQ